MPRNWLVATVLVLCPLVKLTCEWILARRWTVHARALGILAGTRTLFWNPTAVRELIQRLPEGSARVEVNRLEWTARLAYVPLLFGLIGQFVHLSIFVP